MAYYKFTFRKDSITLELESEDSRFMRNQVDKCLEEITGVYHAVEPEKSKTTTKAVSKKQEKVETRKSAVNVEETITEEPQKTEELIQIQEIKEEKVSAPEVEIDVEVKTKIKESIEETAKKASMPVATVIKETQKVEEKVVIETREVPSIEEADEIILSLKEDTPIESLVNNIKTASEEVLISEDAGLDEIPVVEENQEIVAEYKFIEKAKKESIEVIEPVIEDTAETEPPKDQQNNKFYQILQEKFSSLPEMVNSNLGKKLAKPILNDNKFFDTLEELIELKKPGEPIEYLVVTSFYLKEKELLDRYSLKQINSKVMTFVKKPIDHSIIQEAVAKNLIEVVPDYTGMADVTEYTITPEGENFVNEL